MKTLAEIAIEAGLVTKAGAAKAGRMAEERKEPLVVVLIRELGVNEQGGRTAIPAWIDFMRVALDGMPDRELPRPPGIVELRIVPKTGLVAADCRREFEWEKFLVENQPEREPESNCLMASPLSGVPDAGGDPATGQRPSPGSNSLFE